MSGSWTGPAHGEALRELLQERGYHDLPNAEGNISCFNAGAHKNGDKTPSCHVNFNEGLYNCYACHIKGTLYQFLVDHNGMTPKEASTWLKEKKLLRDKRKGKTDGVRPDAEKEYIKLNQLPVCDAVHTYYNADGSVLLYTLRHPEKLGDNLKQGKAIPATPLADGTFEIRRPDRKTLPNKSFPIYNLLDVMNNPHKDVYVVEGEGTVDALKQAGEDIYYKYLDDKKFVPCTWIGGTNAIEMTDFSPLQERKVLVIADADMQGRDAARQIAERLYGMGCQVRIGLPEGESGEDIADWVKQGMTTEEMVARARIQNYDSPLKLEKDIAREAKLEKKKEVAESTLVKKIDEATKKVVEASKRPHTETAKDGTVKVDAHRKSAAQKDAEKELKKLQKEKKKEEDKEKAKQDANPFGEYSRLEVAVMLRRAVADNPYFSVLGQTVGVGVKFRIKRGWQIDEVRARSINEAFIEELAPTTWWLSLIDREFLPAMPAAYFKLIREIIMDAALSTDILDLNNIRGLGSSYDNQRIIFNLGNKLIINGVEHPFKDNYEGVRMRYIYNASVALPYIAPKNDDWRATAAKLCEALMEYAWKEPVDGLAFVGWLMTALAQGTVGWRLNIMLTAPSDRGKSWLLNHVIDPLFQSYYKGTYDASEAALSLMSMNSSLPIVMDEQTPEKMKVVFELLKASSSENNLAKNRADAASKFTTSTSMQVRNPFFMISTKKPNLPPELRNRIRNIYFAQRGKSNKDWEPIGKAIEFALKGDKATELRDGLIRHTGEIRENIYTALHALQGHHNVSRKYFIPSIIAGGVNFAMPNTWSIEDVLGAIKEHDDAEAQDEYSDSLEVLNLILRARISGELHRKDDVKVRETRGLYYWLVQDKVYNESNASSYGVRFIRDKETGKHKLGFAIGHGGMHDLLKIVGQPDLDINSAIMLIPGAYRSAGKERPKFAGSEHRYTSVPESALKTLGYELSKAGIIQLSGQDKKDLNIPDDKYEERINF